MNYWMDEIIPSYYISRYGETLVLCNGLPPYITLNQLGQLFYSHRYIQPMGSSGLRFKRIEAVRIVRTVALSCCASGRVFHASSDIKVEWKYLDTLFDFLTA